MAKSNLIKNLNLTNVSDFSNDAPAKEKRKTLVIYCKEEYITKYITMAFNYYKEIGQLQEYSFAAFLPIALERVEEILKAKYKVLVSPPDGMLAFYKNRSRGKEIDIDKYYPQNVDEMSRITFTVFESTRDKYYYLMHNFYINERSNLSTFSISLFFYDIVNILEKEGVKK